MSMKSNPWFKHLGVALCLVTLSSVACLPASSAPPLGSGQSPCCCQAFCPLAVSCYPGLYLVPNTPTSVCPCTAKLPLPHLFEEVLPFDCCLCLLYLLPRMTAVGFPVLSIVPRSRGSLGKRTMLCSLWCPQYPAGCPTGAF